MPCKELIVVIAHSSSTNTKFQELKTPLAALGIEVEVLNPDKKWNAAREEAVKQAIPEFFKRVDQHQPENRVVLIFEGNLGFSSYDVCTVDGPLAKIKAKLSTPLHLIIDGNGGSSYTLPFEKPEDPAFPIRNNVPLSETKDRYNSDKNETVTQFIVQLKRMLKNLDKLPGPGKTSRAASTGSIPSLAKGAASTSAVTKRIQKLNIDSLKTDQPSPKSSPNDTQAVMPLGSPPPSSGKTELPSLPQKGPLFSPKSRQPLNVQEETNQEEDNSQPKNLPTSPSLGSRSKSQ